MKVTVIRDVKNPRTGAMVPLIEVMSLDAMLKRAQKTRPIWGVPAQLAIGLVRDLVRLDAIEGFESMRDGSWIVKGEIAEPWFQQAEKLFKAYTPATTDLLGWTRFDPKPEAYRLATLVEYPNGFASHAQWGEIEDGIFPNGTKRFIQFSRDQAAYVLRNTDDDTDWWQVVPSLFVATYAWLDE